MDQQLLMEAQMLQQQSQELEQSLKLIEDQSQDLEKFKESISALQEDPEEILANLGRGVYAKSKIVEKELFVEVGSGVVVKKTPGQAIKTIEEQIRKLGEARIEVMSQLESYQGQMNSLLLRLQEEKQD